MADYLPKTFNIPPILTGDDFDGFTVTGVTVNGANPPNALSAASIHFRTSPDATGDPALAINSTSGGITISNVTTWNCVVNSFRVGLTPALYYYDMQFTDSAGKIKTYLQGQWPVYRDVTR